ncbi:MAG: response regulator transcription factor [Bacteroidales bacterium]|jgi:DNA-binding response OmpR family regulator|nr:response regulator transcription factor [Bacteroidales bacterium]NLM92464.1 response regulator transcription factor [Bacteroidales bacterium]
MEQSNIKILLAEDDPNLGTILKAYLEAKGFPTRLCINGQEAYDAFLKEMFQFCILDVMMPIKDGFTLARDIRKVDKKIPILFLTAKAMQEDIIEGLKIGADDYITKPFSMEELLLRINAIYRRTSPEQSGDTDKTLFQLGKYVFDFSRQTLKIEEREQKLTSKEAQLLKMLCDRTNDVLDRSDALNKIWLDDNYFNARSMDVYIAKLRKYLKDDPEVELINVHGKGFKLVVNEEA